MPHFLPYFLFFLITPFLTACGEEREAWQRVPYRPTPYGLEEPPGFVRMAVPADNPMTEEGVALGRQLFFDPILSADSSLSCASCHLPELSFTDGVARSVGIGGAGQRNAPSLVNVGYYYTGLFWDGRSPTLEEQALHPVGNPLEMGSDWREVESRLQRRDDYLLLFRAAFGIESRDGITRALIARALAQYQRTLISADAKFDRVQRGVAPRNS